MKLFLLGLYIIFDLVCIARAQDTANDGSSSGDKMAETCDWVVTDVAMFLHEQKEIIKKYLQQVIDNSRSFHRTIPNATKLRSTFRIQNTDYDVTIRGDGYITDASNPMVIFSYLPLGDCSTLIHCILGELNLENEILQASSIVNPTSSDDCSCSDCSGYLLCTPCISSLSTTRQPTAKTSKTMSYFVQSPSTTAAKRVSSVTNTTTGSSTSNTVPYGANTDKLRDTCEEAQGLSYMSAAIIGVTSFLAGMAVILLCIWILYLKRSSKLCFAKPEKTPEKLTSDRVTKKVIAKYMLSATKDTSVTNAVYFTNETRDTDTATATNSKVQASEEGQGHMNMSKYGDKGNNALGVNKNPDKTDNGSRVYTTLQETEIKPPSMRAHQQTDDENVYRDLDLDHKVDISNAQKDGNNLKVMGQLGILGKADSDVYDHARESAISNHDYFVLQNENFRSNHQPGTQTLNCKFSNAGNQMEHPENTENTYFKLENQ